MTTPPFRVRPKRLSNVDLEWEKRAEELQFQGLANVRSTAERWVATQTALFGLFSALLVVKGRTDISELESGYQVVVGALLLVALLTAAWATWKAAKAAQGTPVEVAWLSGPKLREWEREQARAARGQLHESRVAAGVAVLSLAAALAVTWFGEAKPAAQPEAAARLVTVSAMLLRST